MTTHHIVPKAVMRRAEIAPSELDRRSNEIRIVRLDHSYLHDLLGYRLPWKVAMELVRGVFIFGRIEHRGMRGLFGPNISQEEAGAIIFDKYCGGFSREEREALSRRAEYARIY